MTHRFTHKSISSLSDCLTDISLWMKSSKLNLNSNKTEFIIIGTKQQRHKLSNHFPVKLLDNDISPRIAEKMCQTDQRNFWKEIRCTMNSNVKLPTCIDGVHGDCNIAAMWKHHYSTIFNSVPNSCCAKAHDDIFNNTNIVFDNEINVNVEEMKTIVNGLACNKSPGLDGVSAEHMKFAGPKLCVLMSMVISSIFTHGFIPRSMMESVIVPVIKNKNKRINDKGNYRPICLSNVCSKIVEMALARRLGYSLHSSHNQFGFKP